MTDRGVLRVAIIGAGAGGLSAARHLLEGHRVAVFEAGSHVGGLWVYGNDNGQSVAYESLHINSEPQVTSFRGHPFPPDTPLFPSHREVAAYLDAFADTVGIRPHIRFDTRITSVEPVGVLKTWAWLSRPKAGSQRNSTRLWSPADTRACQLTRTGFVHRPVSALALYRTPKPFEGQRVLVVGVGNSGLDIAADLAPFAAQTFSSARSPVLIMPRMILGVPTPRILSKLVKPSFPWLVQRQILRAVSRVYHGRMEQWGLRTPVTRTHPASSATFMAHVSYQRIGIKPGVADVDGTTVRFTDGTLLEVDTVIAATGYHIDLPFLAKDVAPVAERRLEAWYRIVHPDRPGLYFIGFFNVSGGANIAMMDTQSQLLAAVLGGRADLPSPAQMHADIAAERRFMARRFPSAARYGLELDPARYSRQVREFLGRRVSDPAAATPPTARD